MVYPIYKKPIQLKQHIKLRNNQIKLLWKWLQYKYNMVKDRIVIKIGKM